MAKDTVKTGNKKPVKLNRMLTGEYTPKPVEMFNRGRRFEQERIINILSTIAYVVLLEDDADGNLQTMEIDALIAKIKENKNA